MPKSKLALGLLIVIGFIFASAGLIKTLSEPGMVERMNAIHFGGAWRYFIGITELLGVMGMLLPRTRALALLFLWPYAVGGLALHISFAHPPSRLAPAIIASILIPFSLWLDGYLSFNKTSHE